VDRDCGIPANRCKFLPKLELLRSLAVYAFRGGTMRILLCFLVLTVFLCAATADVDVTGKWAGSFNLTGPNGEMKETTALLKLKQSGVDISGTVGPNEDEQFPIQKGKIEGDKITLEADHEGNTLKIALVLVEADRITGDAQMSREGQTMNAKIDVKRAK
jgi:hypothetical protein